MKKLKIIYEDKYLIVVNKPAGVYTISRDNHVDYNLYDEVKTYVKKKNPQNKIFIVHRLDKDTSGLILFAKDEKVKHEMQNNWQNVERKYYAVVSGTVENDATLESYLYETKSLDVIVTNDKKKGKLAITKYKVITHNNKYSLLDVEIKTGRKNQIRVQLANSGHSIVGDKKYGNIKYNRMLLEAYLLRFIHPATRKICSISMPINHDFQKLFEKTCN